MTIGEGWDFELRTQDMRRIFAAVGAAVTERGMLSISAPRGSGKTFGAWRALDASGAVVVEPIRLDRERLTMADVLTAIVRDLSDERPRHSAEARAGQARRLLRGAANPVALFIDDAHTLHHQTVRGLKRLRELGARGRRTGALAIVLAGQADAARNAPEVGLRTERLVLTGLARGEIVAALRHALRGDIEAAALIAEDPRAVNWLDLRELLRACRAAAEARGEDRITPAAVEAALRPASPAAPRPAPAELADADERIARHLAARGARSAA